MAIRSELHQITNELLVPIHGIEVEDVDAIQPMKNKLSTTVTELYSLLNSSKGAILNLAQTVFKKEQQLEILQAKSNME